MRLQMHTKNDRKMAETRRTQKTRFCHISVISGATLEELLSANSERSRVRPTEEANVCKANTRALQLMPGGTFAGRTIQQRNAMQAGRVKEKAEENSARNRGHQPAQAQLGRSGKNI